FRLRVSSLPSPWHALAALLGMRGVPLRERLATIAFVRRLARPGFRCAPELTVAELVDDQPARVGRHLWAPLCVAALHTPVERASAQIFLNLLRAAFSERAHDSDLLLPRTDLSALFPDAAARYVGARGGQVFTRRSVDAIAANEDAIALGADAASDRYAACVIAVGPHQLDTLVSSVATPGAPA